MPRLLPLALALAVALFGAATRPAARSLFRAGMDASRAERWNEARLAFERSYELVPRASTLLNLAAAQVEVGALVDAAQSYRAFLALPDEGRAAAYRDEAEAALEDAEARIARIALRVQGLRPSDVVEVNGEARVERGGVYAMDPGSNRIVVFRDGAAVGELELTLVEGERRGISMPLRQPAPAAATTAPVAPDAAEAPLLENPWLWVGVGAGVLVLTAVVVTAVAVSSGEEPFMGNLGPGVVTFE